MLSRAVTATWALWASKGNGRKKTVTMARGSFAGELMTEGASKVDPPWPVRRSLSPSTVVTPSWGSMPLSNR